MAVHVVFRCDRCPDNAHVSPPLHTLSADTRRLLAWVIPGGWKRDGDDVLCAWCANGPRRDAVEDASE